MDDEPPEGSHRSKSLTPWLRNSYAKTMADKYGDGIPAIPKPTWDAAAQRWSDDDPKTDAEKHAYCIRREGHCATYLSPSLYAAAETIGEDMRRYVKNQPLPAIKSGLTYSKFAPSDRARWEGCPPAPKRKRIPEGGRIKYCGGVVCMPGKNGNCVACFDDE